MKGRDEIYFPINRARLKNMAILYAVVGFAVLFLALWLASFTEGTFKWVLTGAGVLVFIIIVLAGGVVMRSAQSANSGLVFSSAGIETTIATMLEGLLEWRAVDRVDADSKDGVLLIFPKKPEELIKRASNPAIKRLYEKNRAIYKTPVVIECKYFTGNFSEMNERMQQFWTKYGSKK